jgi:hypothetical protein
MMVTLPCRLRWPANLAAPDGPAPAPKALPGFFVRFVPMTGLNGLK